MQREGGNHRGVGGIAGGIAGGGGNRRGVGGIADLRREGELQNCRWRDRRGNRRWKGGGEHTCGGRSCSSRREGEWRRLGKKKRSLAKKKRGWGESQATCRVEFGSISTGRLGYMSGQFGEMSVWVHVGTVWRDVGLGTCRVGSGRCRVGFMSARFGYMSGRGFRGQWRVEGYGGGLLLGKCWGAVPGVSSACRCFVDAAFAPDSGRVAFGCALFSLTNCFLAAINGELLCSRDPLMAEAMACCEALSWIKTLDIHNVEILMDCQRVVSAILDTSFSLTSYFNSLIVE
ncbi:hypothetical protein DM860_012692 [Cuscuta australis]|uniref:RNase H type-1 domain-containing protein n=1 Tax=Cuscuta australis TaxID=267555 RepID=A0A328DHB4_9ASTE|nr:hypothetical protein DM860_012692 [Cuscuta australis]